MDTVIMILMVLLIVASVLSLFYSQRVKNQASQNFEDRQEFYSSDCDESLIVVNGFRADPKTKEIIYWFVNYKEAYFTVYNDNLNMSKYLTEQQCKYLKDYQDAEDRLKRVQWGGVL